MWTISINHHFMPKTIPKNCKTYQALLHYQLKVVVDYWTFEKISPEQNTRKLSKSNTVAKLNNKLTNDSCSVSKRNYKSTSSIKKMRKFSIPVKSLVGGAVLESDCPPRWSIKCVSRGSSKGRDRYWYIKELTWFLDILKRQQITAQ